MRLVNRVSLRVIAATEIEPLLERLERDGAEYFGRPSWVAAATENIRCAFVIPKTPPFGRPKRVRCDLLVLSERNHGGTMLIELPLKELLGLRKCGNDERILIAHNLSARCPALKQDSDRLR